MKMCSFFERTPTTTRPIARPGFDALRQDLVSAPRASERERERERKREKGGGFQRFSPPRGAGGQMDGKLDGKGREDARGRNRGSRLLTSRSATLKLIDQ